MSGSGFSELLARSARAAMEGYAPTLTPEPAAEKQTPVEAIKTATTKEALAAPSFAYHFKGTNHFGEPIAGTVITNNTTEKEAKAEMERVHLWELETVESLKKISS